MWPLDAVRAWAAQRSLRRCSVVGPGARLDGAPFIDNQGEIRIGSGVAIRSVPVLTHLVTTRSGRIVIGDGVQIGHGAALCARSEITIGDGTIIGPFVVLIDVNFHEIADRTKEGEPRPIHIGRRARIGSGAVILRGATIGDGVIIGPNSVVSRRIPDGACVAGVPARPTLPPLSALRGALA